MLRGHPGVSGDAEGLQGTPRGLGGCLGVLGGAQGAQGMPTGPGGCLGVPGDTQGSWGMPRGFGGHLGVLGDTRGSWWTPGGLGGCPGCSGDTWGSWGMPTGPGGCPGFSGDTQRSRGTPGIPTAQAGLSPCLCPPKGCRGFWGMSQPLCVAVSSVSPPPPQNGARPPRPDPDHGHHRGGAGAGAAPDQKQVQSLVREGAEGSGHRPLPLQRLPRLGHRPEGEEGAWGGHEGPLWGRGCHLCPSQIFLWSLKDNDLTGMAFIDTQLYIHQMISVKNFILAADLMKSISLLRYQEESKTLSLVSRVTTGALAPVAAGHVGLPPAAQTVFFPRRTQSPWRCTASTSWWTAPSWDSWVRPRRCRVVPGAARPAPVGSMGFRGGFGRGSGSPGAFGSPANLCLPCSVRPGPQPPGVHVPARR